MLSTKAVLSEKFCFCVPTQAAYKLCSVLENVISVPLDMARAWAAAIYSSAPSPPATHAWLHSAESRYPTLISEPQHEIVHSQY